MPAKQNHSGDKIMNTKKLTLCAVFSAIALIIFVLEALIPMPASVYGFKIGLANVITLGAMYIIGIKEAFWVLVVRIILGNMFSGQMMSFLYSICGGMLSFFSCALLKRYFNENTMWFLGIVGALCHNIGQVLVAYFMFLSPSLFYYGAVLCAISLFTGTFTGVCSQILVNQFKKINKMR